MVLAERPLTLGEGLPVQVFGLAIAALRADHPREFVDGVKGDGVLIADRPMLIDDELAVKGHGFSVPTLVCDGACQVEAGI